MTIIARALALATKAHEGQLREGTGEPYIVHPMAVAETIACLPHDAGTEEMVAAALLHDVVEDTAVTIDDLRAEFGNEVAQLVGWLTKPDVEGNRKTRKQAELEKLSLAPADAQTIKYADIIDNVKDIRRDKPDFADKYIAEKRLLLTALTKGYEALRQAAWLKLKEVENAR